AEHRPNHPSLQEAAAGLEWRLVPLWPGYRGNVRKALNGVWFAHRQWDQPDPTRLPLVTSSPGRLSDAATETLSTRSGTSSPRVCRSRRAPPAIAARTTSLTFALWPCAV